MWYQTCGLLNSSKICHQGKLVLWNTHIPHLLLISINMLFVHSNYVWTIDDWLVSFTVITWLLTIVLATKIRSNCFVGWVELESKAANAASWINTLFPTLGQFTVLGVTSWGSGCSRVNAPGVYTRVQAANDWIRTTIDSYTHPQGWTILQ